MGSPKLQSAIIPLKSCVKRMLGPTKSVLLIFLLTPILALNQSEAGNKSGHLECSLLLLKGIFAVKMPVESGLSVTERLSLFQGQSEHSHPTWHGSESHIYLSEKYPNLGMKVSRPKAIQDFNSSAERLIYLRYFIHSNEEIAKYVRVVKIQERGPGWLIKEIVTDSWPLQDAIAVDQVAKETLHNLRSAVFNAEYRNNENLLIRDFTKRLNANPLSPNIHWDPVGKKILVIDAL